jgi:hypothetical protein
VTDQSSDVACERDGRHIIGAISTGGGTIMPDAHSSQDARYVNFMFTQQAIKFIKH